MKSSIRHNHAPTALPDFRNLGVWLRILLGINLLGLLWVLARNNDWASLSNEFVGLALWIEPPLFILLPLLHLLNSWLVNLPPRLGRLTLFFLIEIVAGTQHYLFSSLFHEPVGPAALARTLIWAGLAGLSMLGYFAYLQTLYSPALAEARLLALTARIRPHFLYNSLNAVLGVIRHDPKRAEEALEELSDLFRVLMKENRELVLLSSEIALARQYLDLERLRLGDRLHVDWQIDACPFDTLMPPLMLQPLLENAVYHGIEPAELPATIVVSLSVQNSRIRLVLSNPIHTTATRHGNQMALANIRERLMLFYDLEARLETREYDGKYEVLIEVPMRRQEQ